MAFSFAIEAVAITAIVVGSVLTVDKLGAVSLPQIMPPLPRAPKAVTLVETPKSVGGSAPALRLAPARPFVVPTRIPTSVAEIHDDPEMFETPGPSIVARFGVGDSIPGSVPGSTGQPNVVPVPKPAPVPAAKAEPAKPLILGGKVLEAKIVKRVMPVYPPLARQMRLSGTVRLEGVISRAGLVVNLHVVSGHPLLTAAALEAVRQWVYRPTLLNGEPVEVIAPIEVHFTLSH